MTLGKRIRQLRKQKKLTQRQLAEMVQIDFTYLSKIENDRLDYTPSVKTLHQLAGALDADELELLELAQKVPDPLAGLLADKHGLQFLRRAREIIKEPEGWERLSRELESLKKRDDQPSEKDPKKAK